MVWTEEQQDCAGAWWPPVSPRPDTVGLPCLVRSGQQGGGCWTQAGKPSPGKPGLAPAATRGSGRSASAVTPERLRPRRDSRPGPAGTSGQATRSAGSACMSFQEGAHWLSLRCCVSPSVLLLPLPSAHLLCKGGGEKRTNHKGKFLPRKKKINGSPGDAPKCQAS